MKTVECQHTAEKDLRRRLTSARDLRRTSEPSVSTWNDEQRPCVIIGGYRCGDFADAVSGTCRTALRNGCNGCNCPQSKPALAGCGWARTSLRLSLGWTASDEARLREWEAGRINEGDCMDLLGPKSCVTIRRCRRCCRLRRSPNRHSGLCGMSIPSSRNRQLGEPLK